MSAPLPAPLPPLAMPPPSAPAAAPPRAPMPASFAALTIFSLRDRSGPLMSPATRLHSATTDCGGTPLLAGAAADGAGVAGWTAGVGAWATVGLAVVEGDAAGAARDGLGDDQLAVVVLRQRLEPAGDVDRVADGREIDGLGVAHAPDDGGARVDPDADPQRLRQVGRERLAERRHAADHLGCG